MTYPPAGFPPPSGPYSSPDPFQGMSSPADPFQQAGPPLASPSPFGAGAWQAPVFQAGYGQAPPTPEPPRGNKRWLVIAVVVAVVIAAAGTGTLLWWLNARGGESGGVFGGENAPPSAASPLPTSVPPLGALRPPRDQLVQSLEKPLDKPRWSYKADSYATSVLGGDNYTVVISVDNYRDNKGVLALDAASGAPRWPKAVQPANAKNILISQMSTHCVIARAATTIGCAFGGGVADRDAGVISFFDVATGTEKNNVVVPPPATTGTGAVREIYSAGDGFVVVLSDAVVGYRPDGSEAWRTAVSLTRANSHGYGHPGVSVYGDQAIVVTLDGRVLDANTGNPIIQGASALGSAAFSSGFGLSDGDTFDFYDFEGTKTASAPSEGFTFITGFGTDGYRTSIGLDPQTSGSSGLYYPLVYNEATGDLRAFDPASGRVLWTRHISEDIRSSVEAYGIAAYGNGTTCFVILREANVVHVKAQTCETDSDNPFVDAPTPDGYLSLAASDGQRMLFDTRNDNHDEVVSIDGTTGQELWRKQDPNLWLPQWIGNGTYSVKAPTVFRWF